MDLKTIHAAPLLDDAETVELIRRWQETGDRRAGERVTRAYYRLAVGIARQYPSAKGRHFEDAVQEGMLGLLRAMQKFDPSRKVKFSTYAPIWVRAYVVSFLRDRVTTVRIAQNRSTRKVYSNLGRVAAHMHAKGEEVTSSSLADRLGVEVASVERVWALISSYNMRSLDGGGFRKMASTSETPEEAFIDRESAARAKEITSRFLATLSPNARVVFERRMVAEEPATLQAIGDELGLSKERVRQIECEIKRQLERQLERKDRAA